MYPQNTNGHPVAEGCEVIADAVAVKIKDYVSGHPSGLVAIQRPEDQVIYALINSDGVWPFTSIEFIVANGWRRDEVPGIQMRDIAGLRWHRGVKSVDPARYGPDSVVKYRQAYHRSTDCSQTRVK